MLNIRFKLCSAIFLLFTCIGIAQVQINEFMARNDSTLKDKDQEFSDWIELKNTSTNAVNLEGWYLTDDSADLVKWQFPATNILPGAYLVVFASDKDRATAGSELHTNFKLSGDGEYLALVEPDGPTVVNEYSPSFPAQLDDLSYGFAGGAIDLTLIGDEAPCCALVPTDDSEGINWLLGGFDDSGWTFGTLGVGYENSSGYQDLFDIDLKEEMYGINASAYIRIPFVFSKDSDALSLTLRIKYDDGFIAYINGTEVASANAPSSPLWNSLSAAQHSDTDALNFENFNLSSYIHLLVEGQNMLAIHAFNRTTTSSDLLIVPELECRIESNTVNNTVGYLEEPTPGSANTAEIPSGAGPVTISIPGKLCSGPVTVALSAPVAAETIYYTLDGSDPSISSIEYTGPITISSTTGLRARSFETGLALGPISSETYVFLDSGVQSFSSDLPIVIVDNLGGGDIPSTSSQAAFMAFFEQSSDGRTYMTNNFTLGSRAGIRRRGESSLRATNKKPNLAVETWGPDSNEDAKIAPLGMPSESDWILWAPYNFDRAGLRNAFIYDISNQSDNYAVRTRFVEVFLNAYGGNVTMDDYAGLYLFEEKIKRDNDRVDVESITPFDNDEPAITGGYILRIDKDDPDQNLLSGMRQSRLYCIYPQSDEITVAQESYISNFIIDFESQLSNSDPITGYPSYIDVDVFIDHNIFNMLTKNADGLRISTYMHKPRNGKLAMGPIWDFDRSMDSTDGRDDDPLGWDGRDFSYINTGPTYWWEDLFGNADFWQKYIDRWQEIRQNVLSDTNVTATIDTMAAEIAEARVRDISKWGQNPRSGSNGLDGTQQGEVNYLKWWLTTRMNWIDTQLIDTPVFSQADEAIDTPIQLAITAPAGTTVYYTTDGTDPRAPGGLPTASATAYTGAITIQPGSFVQARAWDGTTWGSNPPTEAPWSGPVNATFPQAEAQLYVTEVHYNPADPDPSSVFDSDDFEFIELQNVSDTPLDLRGYTLDGGIEFAFSDGAVELLPPDGYVVIVRNLEAFSTRYNTNGMTIAGEYSGKLSNSGDNIRLEFYGWKIYEIAYSDARGWPAAPNGGGPSLIPINDTISSQGFDILDYPGNWRASTYIGGSPGESDPEIPQSIVINELTAHTDTGLEPPFDSNDQIELYNPTENSITLNAYWFLSDDLADPMKWNIPAGTVIPSKGWVLFDEDDFHPDRTSGFGLDKAGEMLTLSYLPNTAEDRVVECVAFKGQANGRSLGRYPDGNAWFQTLTPTPGVANQLPPAGIHIQELMYNPRPVDNINEDDVLEFILITNASASKVTFDGSTGCTNTWRFNGGIEYDFKPGTFINSGELIWIVPFDPENDQESKALFCSTYDLDAGSITLLGPYSSNLSDSGERIALEQPQASDNPDAPDEISWIVIDEVTWSDEFPWPALADGTGLALMRTGTAGNDPQSWTVTEYSGPKHIITYEKISPGVDTWDGFTTIPNLSNTDYADMNSGNGVTVSIPVGELMFLRSASRCLINGMGQHSADDYRNAISYENNGAGRIYMDLQKIIPIQKIVTYSWKTASFQNQNYDLYYSSAFSCPASDSSITDLSAEGWILLDTIRTEYNDSTDGQIGVEIGSRFGEPIVYARHLLLDIKENSTYYGEIDICINGSFVTNNVPEVWLTNCGLFPTDTTALTDSDGDGVLTWKEFYAGTDPTDSNSVFRITSSSTEEGQQTLHWKAVAGKTYCIEFKADLEDESWTKLEEGIPGVDPQCSWSIPATQNKGFYRIRVE